MTWPFAKLCLIVVLTRPVSLRLQALSVHSDVSRRSVSHSVGSPLPTEELSAAAGGIGGFPVFGGGYPSSLSHLEEGGFEQEEGKAEVTCM